MEETSAPTSETAVPPDFHPSKEFRGVFFSTPSAVAGLCGIGFLFFLAVSAPLLANGKALLLYRGGVLSSPALLAMIAPESPELALEKTFNFLLLYLMGLGILRLAVPRSRKKIFPILALLTGIGIAFPFLATSSRIDKTPWREIARDLPKGEFALMAPVPYGPFESVAPPYEKPSLEHIFGTDHAGRDVFARMIYGARVSLGVGFGATAVSLVLGSIIGLFAGYKGGRSDLWIMRLVEIVICFPTFLLLLILMAILLDSGSRQSVLLVTGVIGFTSWTGLCRLVRGETLKQRSMPYILNCRCLGLPTWKILAHHLLPNVSGPIYVVFTFEVAGAILAESSLSFLGFGVQDPTSSWGELLRQAFPDPLYYWHLMLWPGLAIFIAVCSFNFTGEGLRKALDRKS